MVIHETDATTFTEFVAANEARLRHGLIAALGGEAGREAAAEALAWGWENWGRLAEMKNPVGYLYKVGRDRGRRNLGRHRPMLFSVDTARIPDVEPGLPHALSQLTERQRTVVLLVHCFEWTLSEVAELLGLSKTTVQNHLERGMATLRREIGEDT